MIIVYRIYPNDYEAKSDFNIWWKEYKFKMINFANFSLSFLIGVITVLVIWRIVV